MLTFHSQYRPLTSRPFLTDASYTEYLPDPRLRPYVSCYWVENTDVRPKTGREVLVVPDTCMDIILSVNHTRQKVHGHFSSMQDRPFFSVSKESADRISTFAIRFHFWSAHLFLKLNYKELSNRSLDLEFLEPEWRQFFKSLLDHPETGKQIQLADAFLLKVLCHTELNPNLFNCFHQILVTGGNTSVKEISGYCNVSQRQLERQFLQHVGLPLKRISNLVRYQNVWREVVLSETFDIQDAVFRYGYADQSHLLKEFKRFHGVVPETARKIAEQNR